MDLNKAMIIGRLTRDPEMRTTPNGINVASFSIATNFYWTDQSGKRQEKVEFHNIVAWRKLGETIVQYLHKGSRIYIEGRLQTRQWQAQDGSNRSRTEIVADNMIMLDGRGSAPAAGTGTPAPATPAPESPATPAAAAPADSAGTEEIKVEDIPF